MVTASELAGFFAAHAVWCLSDAASFTPMLAYTTEDGERKVTRLAGDDAAGAVHHGRRQLEDDPFGADDAVLLYDGRIPWDGGKRDAVVIEMRCYGFPRAKATIAVPCTPASAGKFRVYPPVRLEWEGCDDFDPDATLQAFYSGVAAHEHGSRVWDDAFEESP